MGSKKRVFVTGASSELMLQVLSRIDKSKYEVFGLSRNPTNLSTAISWVKGDIQKPESYETELSSSAIIIHAAAITHSKDPQEYFKINVEGTKSLVSQIPKSFSPLFVFISSRASGEESGAYGLSKFRAEAEVKKLSKWLIIRPSEIFGGAKNEGIEKTIQSAMKGGLQLCPTGLESKLYPIHINDAAEGIYQHIFELKGDKRELLLNGGKGFSFSELLKLIQTVSGKKMIVLSVPKRVLKLVALVAKAIPINIGFVPDQVARLYSKKRHVNPPKNYLSLESYLKEKTIK